MSTRMSADLSQGESLFFIFLYRLYTFFYYCCLPFLNDNTCEPFPLLYKISFHICEKSRIIITIGFMHIPVPTFGCNLLLRSFYLWSASFSDKMWSLYREECKDVQESVTTLVPRQKCSSKPKKVSLTLPTRVEAKRPFPIFTNWKFRDISISQIFANRPIIFSVQIFTSFFLFSKNSAIMFCNCLAQFLLSCRYFATKIIFTVRKYSLFSHFGKLVFEFALQRKIDCGTLNGSMKMSWDPPQKFWQI
jgi:hypothetical protein